MNNQNTINTGGGKLAENITKAGSSLYDSRKAANSISIVVIGSSTGGPRALQDVIPLLNKCIPAAVLVVQHMPSGFTRSLAERLDGMSRVSVKEAEEGEPLAAGCVYVAPGDYHMTVESYPDKRALIRLLQGPPVGGHRPSINVTLESLARSCIGNITAVIMTGMGSDGSDGIKALKNANKGFIIAQDEKSSVIYGMPKAAVQTGMVNLEIPLCDIAYEITKHLGVYVE